MATNPTTPHYGIVKYAGPGEHDAMDVFAIYNEAMVTIDNILWHLQGEITEINQAITEIHNEINEMGDKYDAAITDILNKVYGGGTLNPDGTIDWPTDGHIAVGDLNVFGGTAEPTSDVYDNALRSRDLADYDIKAQ